MDRPTDTQMTKDRRRDVEKDRKEEKTDKHTDKWAEIQTDTGETD
jgi:hypothetical protein